MRVAIIGTRGIPNHYGGFEQFAEYVSTYLAEHGHQVYVYCSHNHPYQDPTFNGVHLIRCYDPEYRIGTAGQFMYDLNCIRHSRSMKYEVILNLGYTSSALFMRLFSKGAAVVTNMDGLEWKRAKYSRRVQRFLKYSEGLAVKRSDVLVADSIGIQNYLQAAYSKHAEYIPYGAVIPSALPASAVLDEFAVKPFQYNLVIARMEPENNIDVILEGVEKAGTSRQTLVIGNYKNAFGQYLREKFGHVKTIIFIGPLYDLNKLNALRHYCHLYFHGHSVGGTNPSLLEAMAAQALVCAHDNEFNRYVLEDSAFYFKSSDDISRILKQDLGNARQVYTKKNLDRIRQSYTWPGINKQYETLLLNAAASKK